MICSARYSDIFFSNVVCYHLIKHIKVYDILTYLFYFKNSNFHFLSSFLLFVYLAAIFPCDYADTNIAHG